MKFEKWTLGLAAVGVVSLASAARADEKVNFVQSTLTGTIISGYVDTSAQWNLGTGNVNNPAYTFGGYGKADGFNLNVIQLSISKPLEATDEWASGFNADLWFGPDANALNTVSSAQSLSDSEDFVGGRDFAIRQAYVALRTPVGNGIDWKVGVFDTIIGYESFASPNNPNYSHSYGFTIEPTQHTGILGTYRINDVVSVSAGIANTVGSAINERAHGPNQGQTSPGPKAESYKTYMGSVALTAPMDWGWASGSTLYAGVVNGYGSSYNQSQSSWYVGATLATPVAGLKVGGSFDYLDIHDRNNTPELSGTKGFAWAAALYASYQANEKLSFHLRGEMLHDEADYFSSVEVLGKNRLNIYALTATAQYDLWKNVLSRIEFRWDNCSSGKIFGSNPNTSGLPTRKNAFMLAANIIYKS